MVRGLGALILMAILGAAPAAAQDRSRSTFVLTGAVVMADGQPCPEPVEILLICTGAVRQRTFSQPGGQFSLQLADNKSPTTGDTDTVGSPAGGFGSFNRLGRGLADSGSFGSGRTSKFGRINLSDCEITAALPGFNSDVIHLGIRDVLDSPDIGAIVLHRRTGITGTTISLKSLAAPKDASKAYQKALKELAGKKPKYEKALRELQKAVDRFPEFAAAWNLIGSCELALGETEKALHAFKMAVASDPEFLAPYLSIAEVSLQQNQLVYSALWSSKALERNPDLIRAAYLNAFANYSLGRIDDAEVSILKVRESSESEGFPGSYYLLGLIWAAKGQPAEASRELRQFLALNPDFEAAPQIRQMLDDWVEKGMIPPR